MARRLPPEVDTLIIGKGLATSHECYQDADDI